MDPKRDRITEIGAVKYVNGVETERFHTMVNPGRKLEERIVELTGIHDEDLVNAPKAGEVIGQVLDFLGDLPLLGHSVLFDYSFLKKAAVDNRLKFEKQGIDTLKISKKYLADLEHRNLGYLCRYYQIPLNAHRALEDCIATAQLYFKLCELFYSEEENLFLPHPLIFQVKRDTPALPAQKERLCKLIEQHNLCIEVNMEELTRSEASRLIDRILSGQVS